MAAQMTHNIVVMNINTWETAEKASVQWETVLKQRFRGYS